MVPIRILLVEDDPPTRDRLREVLSAEPDFLFDSAPTLAEARQKLPLKPDILLTDLQLPDGTGLALIGEAKSMFPKIEVMVISVLGDENNVVAAIQAGATGYLLKDSFPEDIAETLRNLLAGYSPISASIARFIVRRMHHPAKPEAQPTSSLTPREIDILWGIAKGYRYAEIADQLGMSRQTVPGHIKNIYRKLQVNTRGEAVFEAVQQGLITL